MCCKSQRRQPLIPITDPLTDVDIRQTAPPELSHPDVLRRILCSADIPTLAACMTVSKSMYDAAGPSLYHTIEIDLHKPVHELEGMQSLARHQSSANRKRNLLRHVEVLKVRAHTHEIDDYGDFGTSIRGYALFPKLKTVYVEGCSRPICPLLKGTHPTTVIITLRAEPPNFSDYGVGIHQLLPTAARLLLLLKSFGSLTHYGKRWIVPTPSLAVPTRRCLIAFCFNEDANRTSHSHHYCNEACLIELLASLAYNQIGQCTVCYTDSCVFADAYGRAIFPLGPSVAIEKGVKAILGEVLKHTVTGKRGTVLRKASTEKEVEDKLNSIRFVSRTDYLEHGDWKGEFDEDEVKAWLSGTHS